MTQFQIPSCFETVAEVNMFSLLTMWVISLTHVFVYVCVFSSAPGSSPTSVTAWRRRAAWSTCARFSGTTSSSGPTSRSVLIPDTFRTPCADTVLVSLSFFWLVKSFISSLCLARCSGERRTSSVTVWSWQTWWRSLTRDWPNTHSYWRAFSRRRTSRRPATSSTAWWGWRKNG